VTLENCLSGGNRGRVSLGSCGEKKYDLTAVSQERTACNIIEPSLGVDHKTRAYAVLRKTVLHYHLGQ
jgi:hypothetical protein